MAKPRNSPRDLSEMVNPRASATVFTVAIHAALALALILSVAWKNTTPPPKEQVLAAAIFRAEAPPRLKVPTPVAATPASEAPESAQPVAPSRPAAQKIAPQVSPPALDSDIAIAKKKAKALEEEAQAEKAAQKMAADNKKQKQREQEQLARAAEAEAVLQKEKKEKENLEIERKRREKETKDKEQLANKQKLLRESEREATLRAMQNEADADRQLADKSLADRARSEALVAQREAANRAASEKAAQERAVAERAVAERAAQKAAADAAAAERAQAQKLAQEKSQRESALASYVAKIQNKVRGNLVQAQDLPGNPEAIFEISQLPSGDVVSVTLRKSTGNRALDDAIARAIQKSSPLPKPDTPDLFDRTLVLKFRPNA